MSEVRINPALVPNSVFDQACRIIQARMKEAIADPKLHAECEAWKNERKEEAK